MEKRHEPRRNERLAVIINGMDKPDIFSSSKSTQAGLARVALCCLELKNI